MQLMAAQTFYQIIMRLQEGIFLWTRH